MEQPHGYCENKDLVCKLKRSLHGETVIVAVYVDDLLCAAENENCLDKVNKKIAQGFNMKDLGKLFSCFVT